MSEKEKGPLFDLFGRSPPLFIRGKEKQTTWGGCILSILMILTIVAAAVFYIFKFFARTELKVSSTTHTTTTYPKIDLKENGAYIHFAFALNDVGNWLSHTYISESFLELKPYLVTYNKET
jgi:hypothetical protein